MRSFTKVKLWLLAVAFLLTQTAHAGFMNFDFTAYDNSYTVNGVIQFADVTNGLNNGTSDGHNILSISGSVTGLGGSVITEMVGNPYQPNPFITEGYIINDVVYTSQPFFDFYGILFDTTGGKSWNLFWSGFGTDYILHSFEVGVDSTYGTLVTSGYGGDSGGGNGGTVPEPGSLLLMGIGLIGFAVVAKRNQKNSDGISA